MFIRIFVEGGQNHPRLQSDDISICILTCILVGRQSSSPNSPLKSARTRIVLDPVMGAALYGHNFAAGLRVNSRLVRVIGADPARLNHQISPNSPLTASHYLAIISPFRNVPRQPRELCSSRQRESLTTQFLLIWRPPCLLISPRTVRPCVLSPLPMAAVAAFPVYPEPRTAAPPMRFPLPQPRDTVHLAVYKLANSLRP
jgi:hypothetical protein